MEEELKDIGLSEKEIKVFLASQKLGPSTANELAIKSGVIRTTTYEILESLKQKGLIGNFEKDNKLFFESISPNQLLALLKEKQKNVEKILPELESIRNTSYKEKSSVQIYIGQKGIKAILEEILDKKLPYLTYANADLFEKFNYYYPNFIKRRIELKIPIKIIEEETELTKQHKKEQKKSYREIKFSPIRFSASAFIYGDNVLFLDISNEDLVGILIKDKKIADLQREVFEIMWKSSKT